MTKAEIISNMSAQAGITKAQAEFALASFTESVKTATTRGEHVTIPHLGTFRKVALAERMGRNPKTGEAIPIPASTKLAFKQAAELKG